MRKSFVFYRSFFDTISKLPSAEVKAEAYEAIAKYALYGEDPEGLSFEADLIFGMAKPQLDANEEKASGGAKGGRPKTIGSKSEKPKVSKKENHRLENKKPNENDNDNANENENANEYTKEFANTLSEFRQMRKSIKKPLTANAEKRLIARLKKLSPDEETQIRILQQSIDHCWLGVFELKDEGYKDIQPVYEPTKSEVTDEELQAFKERWS